MDALIATHVMGWATERQTTLLTNIAEWSGRWVYPDTSVFSTDITHAWQVVKAMNATRRMLSLDQLAEGAWVARFRGSTRVDEARGESEAAAICRAALLAVLT
jgi:hypothetical protein